MLYALRFRRDPLSQEDIFFLPVGSQHKYVVIQKRNIRVSSEPLINIFFDQHSFFVQK